MNDSKKIRLAIIFLLIFHSCAFANVRYPHNLWKGLLREAVGEGYMGMYYVAQCVRNRLQSKNAQKIGHGLVGLKKYDLDLFVRKCGLFKKQQAKDIVYKVFVLNESDRTNGALYFESVDFPENIKNFDRKYQRCWKYKKHIFYKEK